LAAKPETTFYTSVHKHLPSPDKLHREKMANPYRGGTADHWYDGQKADLWVEWKFIVLPKRDDTIIDLVTPRGKKGESPLSALQQDWLGGRYINGRSVWVIVGCKEGGVIMRAPDEWNAPWKAGVFRANLQSRPSIAAAILEHTGLCR
jgi:hypothetical protein